MSASGPPLCRLCGQSHWMRDPHILPANAKGELRAKRAMIENNVKTSSAIKTGNATITLPAPAKASTTNTSAEKAKGRKAGNARRDSSADCSSSRFTAQAGGKPAKNIKPKKKARRA